MRPSQFTDEQIIGMLKEQEAGAATADVCRKHGISSATFYKFKVSMRCRPPCGERFRRPAFRGQSSISAGSAAGELGVDDETYVRRRRWSTEEKRAVVTEALSSGNVIATAKRHGIQAQQIYRWRERLDERQSPTAFLPVSMAPDAVPLSPAPMPDQDHRPAALLDRSPRVEIVLSCGRRIIAEGGVDVDAMLELARGLEALR